MQWETRIFKNFGRPAFELVTGLDWNELNWDALDSSYNCMIGLIVLEIVLDQLDCTRPWTGPGWTSDSDQRDE